MKERPMPDSWIWASAPVQIAVSAIPAKFGSDYTLPKDEIPAKGIQVQHITLQPFGTTSFRVSMSGAGK